MLFQDSLRIPHHSRGYIHLLTDLPIVFSSAPPRATTVMTFVMTQTAAELSWQSSFFLVDLGMGPLGAVGSPGDCERAEPAYNYRPRQSLADGIR